MKQAKRYAAVNVAASGAATGSAAILPRSEWKLAPQAAYVHICSNVTIRGVEYHWTFDTGGVPLIAAMSSNILSQPVEVERYGLIYAGAQKNIGQAGLMIVIVRGDLIGRALPITPSVFDYAVQPRPTRCTTRRTPRRSTSPGWCSSGSRRAAGLQTWVARHRTDRASASGFVVRLQAAQPLNESRPAC